MYTFLKLKDKIIPDYVYDYQLYCTDVKTLFEHMEKYLNCKIKEGIEDILKCKDSLIKGVSSGHWNTIWSQTIIALAQSNESTWLRASTKLETDIFKGRIKCLIERKNITLKENGIGYMFYDPETHIILDKIEKNDMIYPDSIFTEKDIRVFKWQNGNHFYCKIKELDVVDEYGEQKWNTDKEAYEQGLKFLNRINNGNKT